MASVRLSAGGNISPTFLLLVLLLLRLRCSAGGPIAPAHPRQRPGGVWGAAVLEQDGSMAVEEALEGLKEQFLKSFNLSSATLSHGNMRVEPPDYMMELYNRFANDRTSMPTANIIRSFNNEDSSPSVVGIGGARHHPLLFNVSVPHHERITAAELRLYTLVQTDRRLYAGVDRRVVVYELEWREGNHTGQDEVAGLLELASRQVYGTDDGWEAFDLTAAAQRWRRSERGTTHRLEVRIASMYGEDVARERRPNAGDMKIDTSARDGHRPLLIVFSDDQSGERRDNKRELSEMIDHETSNALPQEGDVPQEEPDEEALVQMRSNMIYDASARIRRNAKGNHCRKQSLYVEFKDIGWDSWILAPAGYDAFECSGVCSFPLTKHVTPTKHAIVQTLVNINTPHRAARACCVPTQLEPISLLYLDDTGVVTYKYKFEGMVVGECGCR